MRLLLMFSLCLPLAAADLWTASVAAYGGAQVADIASSLGKLERNPVFGQRFTARDAALKGGIAAGNITVQVLILRKWPSAKRAAAVVNFVAAGVVTVVAVRNAGAR